ncbi:response regulator [Peptococcaceae bacterium 1198_IL3148]
MKRVIDILIVDDQPGVRYLLDILIKEMGHNTYSAQNGLEAVEIVKRVKPDLVFMDVRMPVMDGLEALTKIKAISPSVNVVMMTANFTEETIDKAMQKGASKCMAKPFDVEDIRDIIEEHLWNAEQKKIEMINNCV